MFDLELMRRLSSIADISEADAESARGHREGQEDNDRLESLEATAPQISDEAVVAMISSDARDLVVKFEVSGRDAYERRYKKPIWPRGKSGITVGIGYDVGYNSAEDLKRHWANLLSEPEINLLCSACGRQGENANAILAQFSSITVPWDVALQVFDRSTMPRYGRMVLRAFPNAADLHGHAFGALFSLVFNRGPSTADNGSGRRREMSQIREAMAAKQYRDVPRLIRDMKRLWPEPELRGLRVRRDAEALLFERGLEIMTKPVVVASAGGATNGPTKLETISFERSDPAQSVAARDGDGQFQDDAPDGPGVLEGIPLWEQVQWAHDGISPDYSHVQDQNLTGTTFEFGAAEFELLLAANCFDPTRDHHRIVFALRGAALVTAREHPSVMLRQEDRERLTLQDVRPNHQDFRCVIGVYNTATKRLSGYTASTVPNRKAVAAYYTANKIGNMMPTGCYRFEIGWHQASREDRKIPGCLIENGRQKAVLRSTNNLVFDVQDTWETHRLHGDNLHPAKSEQSAKFSSWGCLVVNGNYAVGDDGDRARGTHTGEWGLFRQALGLAKTGTSDHNKQFDVVLLTGLEAAIAHTITAHGQASDAETVKSRLGRLRQGSAGERVARLRRGLNLPAGKSPAHIFDSGLAKAFADRQLQDFKSADGVYSPAMERHYRFGVFDPVQVVVAMAQSGAGGVHQFESVGANATDLETLRRDPKSQMDALYYEMGLYAAAAQKEGQPVRDEAYESLGNAQLEFSFDWVKAQGLEIAKELERRLKEYFCGGTERALLTHGRPAGERLDAAIAKGGENAKEVLVEILTKSTLIIPTRVIASFVDVIYDKIFAPVISGTGHFLVQSASTTTADLCRNWSGQTLFAPNIAPNTLVAAPPRSKYGDELGRMLAAANAVTPDFPRVHKALSDLREHLKQSGERLEPPEVEQLLSVLCDTRFLHQAAGSQGSGPYPLFEKLTAATQIKTNPQARLDAVNEALSELDVVLSNPRTLIQVDDMKAALNTLRRGRMFEAMTKLADQFLARDPKAIGGVSQGYAQGLIDSGRIVAGIDVLEAALKSDGLTAHDRSEANGLLGRAHKQIYVNHVKTPSDAVALRNTIGARLTEAVAHYGKSYDVAKPGENYWHGINLIALMARAKRDGIVIDGDADAETLARKLVAALEPKAVGTEDPWLLATLGEAFLALGDTQKAAGYMGRYAKHPKTDAFALAGTVRQLEQVWQLQAGPAGPGAILTNLKAALAQKDVGMVKLLPEERQAIAKAPSVEFQGQFETVIAGGKSLEFVKLKRMVNCGSAVTALQSAEGELKSTQGTGFLVHGYRFDPSLPKTKSYVLTNAHVLWDQAQGGPSVESALTPNTAQIVFENDLIDGRREPYKCLRVVWQSPPHLHDATLFELDRKVEHIQPLELAPPDSKLVVDADGSGKGSRLAVIGHPNGGKLTYAVRGSLDEMQATLIDKGCKKGSKDPEFLHYTMPTEGGNSGSPVFDVDTWQVVALHHAGYKIGSNGLPKLDAKDGFNFANEGIAIESIRLAIAAAAKSGAVAANTTKHESVTPTKAAPKRPFFPWRRSGGGNA